MKITSGGSSTRWWLKGYVEGGLKCWRGVAGSVTFEACQLCIVLEWYGWDMKVMIHRKRKREWFVVIRGEIGCRRRRFSMVKVDVTCCMLVLMLEGWSEAQWKHVDSTNSIEDGTQFYCIWRWYYVIMKVRFYWSCK